MLSLVVPTYNERPSLELLFPRLERVAQQLDQPLEVILVDDNSPDRSADFGQSYAAQNYGLRVVRREGKFGLASAVIEGWRSARGEYLGVIDADGSHDETLIPKMLQTLTKGEVEVAVASRYVKGGGFGDWPVSRRLSSLGASLLGRAVCPIKDVTSGFFLFHRGVLEGVSLDPEGFSIGLEVLVRGRYRRFAEFPYIFSDRKLGRSKLSNREILTYIVQMGRLLTYRYRHLDQRRSWQRLVKP